MDFLKHPDIKELYSDDVFSVREVEDYGFLPYAFLGYNYELMVYDKRLAKKIGIEPKSGVLEVSELENYAKAVFTYNQNLATPNKVALLEDWLLKVPRYLQASMIEYRGMKFRGANGEFLPDLMDILSLFERLSKYDPLIVSRFSSKIHENPWFAEEKSKERFLDGKVLFYVVEVSQLLEIRKENQILFRNFGFLEMPEFRPRTKLLHYPYDAFILLKASKKKELAKEFIKFMYGPKYAKNWIKYTFQLPVTKIKPNFVPRARVISDFIQPLYKKFDSFYNQDQFWDWGG